MLSLSCKPVVKVKVESSNISHHANLNKNWCVKSELNSMRQSVKQHLCILNKYSLL